MAGMKKEERTAKLMKQREEFLKQQKQTAAENSNNIIDMETSNLKDANNHFDSILKDVPQVDDPFSSAPLKERDYTKDNTVVTGGAIPNSVPEPQYDRPIIDISQPQEPSEYSADAEKEPERPRFEGGDISNPAFEKMKAKQQKESARLMADTIVDGYAQINHYAKELLVKTDFNKLQQKALMGKFDMDALNVELPVAEGQTVSVGQVLRQTNAAADEIFVVSEDFTDETRELWVEVLKEKGLGMSPIQRLIALYGQDVAVKGIAAYGLLKTNKEFLGIAMNVLMEQKKKTMPVNTNYTPEPPKPQAPQPEPDPEIKIEQEQPQMEQPRKQQRPIERPIYDDNYLNQSESLNVDEIGVPDGSYKQEMPPMKHLPSATKDRSPKKKFIKKPKRNNSKNKQITIIEPEENR